MGSFHNSVGEEVIAELVSPVDKSQNPGIRKAFMHVYYMHAKVFHMQLPY